MKQDYANYTEAALWHAFKKGNDEAYAFIYRTYAPQLYNYGRHLSKDQPLVEDCLHDLFVHLYQHRSTLGETDSIKFYLFRSLRRRIAESAQQQGKFTDSTEEDGYRYTGVTPSPESLLIEDQSGQFQQQYLQEAMEQLPKRQRESLYLLYYNNLSYQEVAAIMSLEVRTVYNQVHNALNALKKHLSKFPLHLLITLLLTGATRL